MNPWPHSEIPKSLLIGPYTSYGSTWPCRRLTDPLDPSWLQSGGLTLKVLWSDTLILVLRSLNNSWQMQREEGSMLILFLFFILTNWKCFYKYRLKLTLDLNHLVPNYAMNRELRMSKKPLMIHCRLKQLISVKKMLRVSASPTCLTQAHYSDWPGPRLWTSRQMMRTGISWRIFLRARSV